MNWRMIANFGHWIRFHGRGHLLDNSIWSLPSIERTYLFLLTWRAKNGRRKMNENFFNNLLGTKRGSEKYLNKTNLFSKFQKNSGEPKEKKNYVSAANYMSEFPFTKTWQQIFWLHTVDVMDKWLWHLIFIDCREWNLLITANSPFHSLWNCKWIYKMMTWIDWMQNFQRKNGFRRIGHLQ